MIMRNKISRAAVKLVVPLMLLSICNISFAQENSTDFDVELQALEATTPIPASQLPDVSETHGFYSAQNPDWPPAPADILGVPAWSLGDGFFAMDDLNVNYANLAQAAQPKTSSSSQLKSKNNFSPDFLITPANIGFSISQQATNIVLKWQSTSNRIYMLEQRPTLTSDSYWTELANYVLSASTTNVTSLVLTNLIRQQPIDFFRLFDVTPIASNDFFSVAQDSSANQLDIFQNDVDPNGDPIFISNIVPASHGSISYSLDATTFQYTPTAGFYGIDTFQYSITSGYGDVSSNATVTVFVNRTGNSPPVVPDISITLPTNTYTATFNAITNATDPDGDTISLYAVTSPSMGSVSNDASGNIYYTRNPNLFGQDSFTYIVTDGKGGYGVGNVKILQVDTDGDGMPDQWETKYGLNPTTDDSMADPDGDGLPNFAEFILGTNPHVADNPLNFSGVPNGAEVSGFAQLPVLGLNPLFQTFPIILYVNGSPAQNSLLSQAADGQWLMNWDTSFLTNGDYQIQLGFQINPPTLPDLFTNILGSQKTVEVNNPITFDRLTSQFNNFLLIDATLAVTNSTYDAYLYDDNGDLLVYATGLSAPNGQVQLYWDLTDGNGHQISFGNIQAVFNIHPPAPLGGVRPLDASSSSASHWFLKDAPNVDETVFAVAWGYDFYSTTFYNYRTEAMQDGVINILGNPSDVNAYTLLPANNVPYGGSAFRYDDELDRSVLINPARNGAGDFGKSGNFFWFGHGGESGDDFICGNTEKSNITAEDVENDLQNKAARSTSRKPTTNKHPYRLTILNACDTYSPGWSSAFGVDFSANGSSDSAADYVDAGRSQRAFVGWTKKIGIPGGNDLLFGGLLDAEYAQALGYLFGDWMDGYPLDYCMGQFSSSALASEPTYFQNADSWQISGCYDLERDDQ
jgi:Bacterial Ig domain/Bacterial TSP3 repeat